MEHLARKNMGMKAQLLLIAPKPESRPRMIVPTTMSLVRAAVIVFVSGDWRASGRGMWEKRKR
jgi:hypothetical protein